MSDSILEATTNLQLEISRAKARFRIRDECLQIAIKALTTYSKCTFGSFIARSALERIEELLVKLEYM